MKYEDLIKILYYDPSIGRFTYIKARGPKAAGSIAGTLHRPGYRNIEINGKVYLEHRLVWLYTYKVWPTKNIDHINRVKDDNRVCNLREVTHSTNMYNKTLAKNNTSGFTGVSPYNNKWKASIGINGKPVHIGYFETKEEANDAYIRRKKQVYEDITIS